VVTFHLHVSKKFPTTAVTFLRHFALGPVPTILQLVFVLRFSMLQKSPNFGAKGY